MPQIVVFKSDIGNHFSVHIHVPGATPFLALNSFVLTHLLLRLRPCLPPSMPLLTEKPFPYTPRFSLLLLLLVHLLDLLFRQRRRHPHKELTTPKHLRKFSPSLPLPRIRMISQCLFRHDMPTTEM